MAMRACTEAGTVAETALRTATRMIWAGTETGVRDLPLGEYKAEAPISLATQNNLQRCLTQPVWSVHALFWELIAQVPAFCACTTVVT
jgi:hypothetical protein